MAGDQTLGLLFRNEEKSGHWVSGVHDPCLKFKMSCNGSLSKIDSYPLRGKIGFSDFWNY
jgi:hypothetical protein